MRNVINAVQVKFGHVVINRDGLVDSITLTLILCDEVLEEADITA